MCDFFRRDAIWPLDMDIVPLIVKRGNIMVSLFRILFKVHGTHANDISD